LMEIPISMIVLSRVLKYTVNRWVNMIAATIMTIVQISSLFSGTTPTSYYIFFSLIEISCTLYIAWCAWKWTK
jgi:threonine/homoserine/homoserine lactone efflux protein